MACSKTNTSAILNKVILTIFFVLFLCLLQVIFGFYVYKLAKIDFRERFLKEVRNDVCQTKFTELLGQEGYLRDVCNKIVFNRNPSGGYRHSISKRGVPILLPLPLPPLLLPLPVLGFPSVFENQQATLGLGLFEPQLEPLDCPPGPPGRPGSPGRPGPRGPAGPKGVPGSDGPKGAPGETGLHGFSGDKGDIGKRGPVGEKGAVGPPGAPGIRGETGKIGTPGQKGEPGDAGTNGRNGVKGKPGVPGDAGEEGRPGAPGTPGIDGKEGKVGPPGEKGEQGTNYCLSDAQKGQKSDQGIDVSGLYSTDRQPINSN